MCSIDDVYISSCRYYHTTNLGGVSATILDPVSESLKKAAGIIFIGKPAACSRPLF